MAAKKKWNELTKAQKGRIMVLGAGQLALQAAAIRDITKRPAEEVNGPKGAWIAATFLNFVGPIAYFLAGRRKA